MVYLNTIPTATSTLSASQPQLLENFSQLQTQWSKDHASLLAGALPNGTGKHLQVTLPQRADPVPLPAATEAILYSKTVGAVAELWLAQSTGYKQLTTGGGSISGFVKAFATFTIAGVIVVGSSYNINAPVLYAGRVYTVTFTTALLNNNYTVIATPFNNSNASYTAYCTEKLPGSFKVAVSRLDVYSNIPVGVLVLGM